MEERMIRKDNTVDDDIGNDSDLEDGDDGKSQCDGKRRVGSNSWMVIEKRHRCEPKHEIEHENMNEDADDEEGSLFAIQSTTDTNSVNDSDDEGNHGNENDERERDNSGTVVNDLQNFETDDINRSLYKTLKSLRKATLSITNRLRSIFQDSEFVTGYFGSHTEYSGYPLIANERCGSWYIPPALKGGSAYFKSTDGHYGQWAFSLRRLNLDLLRIVGEYRGAVLVDSTRRGKSLPDALRRTVPIWVAVWNRILFGSESSLIKINNGTDTSRTKAAIAWKFGRFQNCGLSASEVRQIENRIKGWCQDLQLLGLDIASLKAKVRRPMRCVWVIHDEGEILPDGWNEWEAQSELNDISLHEWNTLVLCSASRRVVGAEMSEDGYVQGAGDDSEGWSRGLTASLFWQHRKSLMAMPEDDLPQFIQKITDDGKNANLPSDVVQILPTSNLHLSMKSGLNAILRARQNYNLVICCDKLQEPEEDKNFVILGCRSGKLGSRDLRDQLPRAKEAALRELADDPRCKILVFCETGKDLSVGVLLVLLCLFYDDQGNLDLQHKERLIDKQLIRRRLVWISTIKADSNPSRSTLQAVNSFLFERPA